MNNELIKIAKSACSADELAVLAKENGIELTEEDAEKYFDFSHTQNGELSDNDLNAVCGGEGHSVRKNLSGRSFVTDMPGGCSYYSYKGQTYTDQKYKPPMHCSSCDFLDRKTRCCSNPRYNCD